MSEQEAAIQVLPIQALLEETLDAFGMLDCDLRSDGVSPRRLPGWTRIQTPPLMDVVVRMPSGVRLRFRTAARRIGLEFHATNLVTPPAERRPVTFDLEIGGELHGASSTAGNAIVMRSRAPGDFELVRGAPDTVWFEDLPAGDKHCELWLPHNAMIELRALHVEAPGKLQAPRAESRRRWAHYGSSISHCMEADRPGLIWPAVAARRNDLALQNFGFGGQCHLDQFVARTLRDGDADVISIKTGINVINMDSMRERTFTSALHGFLDTVREGKPDVPIILVSPIYCPSAETRPGPTVPAASGKFVTLPGHEEIREGCMTLTRVREILAEAVEQRRAAGDPALSYVDGLTLFGAADAADLPDDLHPNADGYVRMGERFAPILEAVLSG